MASQPPANKKDGEPPVSEGEAEGAEASGSTMTLEGLTKYLKDKLHFHDSSDAPKKEKILADFSIDEIAKLIESGKFKKIVTLAGAGISTSAGIPDFRSPGSGLYDNLQKYNLPHPQAVFELDFFDENPKPFFALAKELYPGSFKPTPSHYFIKLLEQKGVLLRHYTQNIDTLERVAAIEDKSLVEAHGTFYTGHCRGCSKKYSLAWMKEKIFADEIPICESCPGVVKPDIVFFGENLPDKFYEYADSDLNKCDLLIVMGSSLVVQPFASLVDRVRDSCPRLLINREKVGQVGGIMSLLGMGGGFDFDSSNNTRDVCWLGDCDEGCHLLADKIGWGDELKKLVAEEHKRIDKEQMVEKEKQSPKPKKKTVKASDGSKCTTKKESAKMKSKKNKDE